jgi:hypothetical protein
MTMFARICLLVCLLFPVVALADDAGVSDPAPAVTVLPDAATTSPLDAGSFAWKIYKSGHLIPAIIVGLFFALAMAPRWLSQGRGRVAARRSRHARRARGQRHDAESHDVHGRTRRRVRDVDEDRRRTGEGVAMAETLRRNLGPISHLDPGEYTLSTASGDPAVRCPKCGGISDLEIKVLAGGGVADFWSCPFASCSFQSYLVLESHDEPVLL